MIIIIANQLCHRAKCNENVHKRLIEWSSLNGALPTISNAIWVLVTSVYSRNIWAKRLFLKKTHYSIFKRIAYVLLYSKHDIIIKLTDYFSWKSYEFAQC